jgi:hypothetical protein
MTHRRCPEPIPYRPLTPEEVDFLLLFGRTDGNTAGLARYCGVDLDADNARRLGDTAAATERLLAEVWFTCSED